MSATAIKKEDRKRLNDCARKRGSGSLKRSLEEGLWREKAKFHQVSVSLGSCARVGSLQVTLPRPLVSLEA